MGLKMEGGESNSGGSGPVLGVAILMPVDLLASLLI